MAKDCTNVAITKTISTNANSGLKENRKGRKQGKLSNYKKIDEVTHGRHNKTVLFGR
ncbi:hypothetical protein [Wolbachia endosymbiont (group A) of Icerya purchasi]|uniref:hypothetical protein n=1 Tax=Wolbachia endosymbiont (group A) of Icerya purchasi TaxID=2954019 RepID=UPI0022314D2A|nr:hypothetical protein [Wolbachia endosymbiont (group A) of Icerya purchasi]